MAALGGPRSPLIASAAGPLPAPAAPPWAAPRPVGRRGEPRPGLVGGPQAGSEPRPGLVGGGARGRVGAPARGWWGPGAGSEPRPGAGGRVVRRGTGREAEDFPPVRAEGGVRLGIRPLSALWWRCCGGRCPSGKGLTLLPLGWGGRSRTPLRSPLGHPRGAVLGASEPGNAGVSHRELKAPVRSAF